MFMCELFYLFSKLTALLNNGMNVYVWMFYLFSKLATLLNNGLNVYLWTFISVLS